MHATKLPVYANYPDLDTLRSESETLFALVESLGFLITVYPWCGDLRRLPSRPGLCRINCSMSVDTKTAALSLRESGHLGYYQNGVLLDSDPHLGKFSYEPVWPYDGRLISFTNVAFKPPKRLVEDLIPLLVPLLTRLHGPLFDLPHAPCNPYVSRTTELVRV